MTNQKDVSVAERMALAREDLSSLREMRATLEKRIQQLEFDSRGAARIQQIEQARPNGMPVKDGRRKLWALTPFVALALVLSLFLVVELRGGGAADLDEMATPGTARRKKKPSQYPQVRRAIEGRRRPRPRKARRSKP